MSQMDALMKEINKEFKGDILHRGLAAFDYERIPFTSPRLNYMTYGGIPKGKLIEFYGEEHGGKTTTALDIVANYQTMENAKGVVYADLENTLDSVWATKLGVDFTRDDIWVMNPTNQGAETIFEKILQMIATDEVGLVVIDSLGVMVSNQALEKSVEDKTYGGIAMALTNFSKKAEMLCHKHNCTIIGINQMRDDMNSMYGGVTTTGGKAWKHNCFSGNTRFVTDRGLRRFRDCKDGEIVTVVDKDGELREAQVHYYGKQMLQRVKLHTPNQQFEVVCTPDHRWVLADGSVTTNLRVGDKLYYRPDNTTHIVSTRREAEMFCMGMAIADGCDYTNKKSTGIRVVLCGDKVKYSEYFELAGYRKSIQNGHIAYSKLHTSKQRFLNGECWKYLSPKDNRYLFAGYYAGDGATHGHSCCTVDNRVLEFIRYTCNLAGYFISSERSVERTSGYANGKPMTCITFTTHTNKYNGWVVESIEPFGVAGTYCVEEPVTHTFTLERGIVTGNCSVRLEFRRGRFFDDKYKEVSRSAENPAGNYVQVSMAKNKTCPPKRHTGFYTLRYEVGIDYLYDLIEVGIKYGIIDKAGAWYSIIDPDTGELIVKLQGQNGVYTYLEDPDNMEVLAKIESYIEAQTDKD
jgi:recombination protein RecA